MIDAAGVVASIVSASRVSSSIVASIVASRAAWMVVTVRHRENRNRLVKKSMPLAKTTGFLCIFRKKLVVSLQFNVFCHSFLLKSVTFLCR